LKKTEILPIFLEIVYFSMEMKYIEDLVLDIKKYIYLQMEIIYMFQIMGRYVDGALD
jgi:hypothetical protein